MQRSDLADIARDPTLRAAALRGCPEGEREALSRKMDASLQARAVRSAQGRAAQAHGETFEAWLAGQHAEALRLGVVARLRHVGAPTICDRKGVPHYVGVGPADFQGTLPGGLSLVMEAKSVGPRKDNPGARLVWSDIPEHQREDLDACEKAGGLSVLLYEHRPSARRFAVPWGRVPWRARRAGDHGSIGPEECGAFEIAPGESCYLRSLIEQESGR